MLTSAMPIWFQYYFVVLGSCLLLLDTLCRWSGPSCRHVANKIYIRPGKRAIEILSQTIIELAFGLPPPYARWPAVNFLPPGDTMAWAFTRCTKLRVVYAPGMPGTFSPPPTSKETASLRSQHASRHVRHARVVMHVRIANPRWWGKVPGIPGACVTRI